MPAHRLQALLNPTSTATASVAKASCGFMPCPATLLSTLATPQHLFIHEVYRVARERVEAQFRPAFRLPEFSLN